MSECVVKYHPTVVTLFEHIVPQEMSQRGARIYTLGRQTATLYNSATCPWQGEPTTKQVDYK